jgi:membrane protease YdiL (CAAX protease family)
MPAESVARRAGAFLRSILPAEPAHWLILVGSTLLFISANLRWWAGPFPHYTETHLWRTYEYLVSRLLVVAGAAGYYLCFIRRKVRSYYPFQLVFLPTAIVLMTVMKLAYSWFTGPGGRVSVIAEATGEAYLLQSGALKEFALDFGTGFWIAGFGFVLVAVFLTLLYVGRATLPVSLSAPRVTAVPGADDQDSGQRTMLFVWMMICLIPLTPILADLPVTVLSLAWNSSNSHLNYLTWVSASSGALSLFLLALLAMGTNAKEALRQSFRLPPVQYLAIAIMIPATVAAIWPMAQYSYERIHWAANNFGRFEPPQLTSYFGLPRFALLWAVIPALIEEIAWRGFLQPRFIRKYGIARGVFFVGIAWGAFHFSGDFHGGMTLGAIAISIVRRLCGTVAQSYVLAWLTMRSKSVLPAALAHAFHNIFLYYLPIQAPHWLQPPFWAVCGWILFRYFPMDAPDPRAVVEPGPMLGPAT